MRTLILVLLIVTPLPLRAASNVLENDLVRFEVSPQNGSILHLVDKRTGTDYISDSAHSELFRLAVPNPDYTARMAYQHFPREINSRDQKADSVEVENGVLKIHFRKLQVSPPSYGYMIVGPANVPEPQYDIEVTVTFRLEGPHIVSNIQVNNHSPEQIADVFFPLLSGLTGTSDGQRAKVVIPSLSQKFISSTLGISVFRAGAKPYPSLLATSWVNYQFKGKGLGIEIQTPPETEGTTISLAGRTGGASVAWEFHPNIPGQSTWTSPVAILHVHDSDWHTIATEHREWYRKHFSPPPSNAFKNAIGFATYRLKRDDNTVNWTYDEIPKLAGIAESAGIHDLVIEGWRKIEGPGNPCPFGEIADPRMGGGPRLKALIDKLHHQGVELAFAFHPTLINTAAKQYNEIAHGWTIESRIRGHQLRTSFIFISQDYPYEDIGAHFWAQIDPASPATDYLLQQAKRLKEEYGFRNLFLRGVGLPSFLSFNQKTAVPPQKTYAVGYARFLGGLKKIFPQGILMTEGLNDLVNRYASAAYTWSQSDGAQVLALSLPWVPFSNDVEALDYDQANASFARKILINLIVDGGDGTVARYAEFARHLKALQDLKNQTHPYYADAEFRDHQGIKKLSADPEVVISAFLNAATKQRGIVAANLSNEKKKVSLELDLSGAQSKGRLFRLAGGQEEVELAPQTSMELGPYEVVILGIDPK